MPTFACITTDICYALLQMISCLCTFEHFAILNSLLILTMLACFTAIDIKTFNALLQLLTLEMQNMKTECSNNLNYNNRNNINTLTAAKHFYKTRCGPTDRQTDRPTLQSI